MFRVIIKNFISLSLINFVDLIITLLIITYLITTVGETNYGIYVFAYSFIFYFRNISQYGFSLSAVKRIALIRDDKSEVNQVFNEVLSTRLILTIFVIILIVILVLIFPKLYEHKTVFWFISLIILGECFTPIWYFQGIEKMEFATIINVISKLTFIIFIYSFVKAPEDYIFIGLYQAIGFLIAGLISMFYIIKVAKINIKIVNWKIIKINLKESFSSFLILTVPTLYSNTSIFLLGIYTPYRNVTILEAGTKISSIFSTLTTIVTKVFYPFLNRNKEKKKLITRIQIVLGLFSTILMYISAPLLVKFWFKSNDISEEILIVVKLLSLSPFLFSIIYAFGINGLLIENRENVFLKATAIASIIGLILAVIVIPKNNYIGAAIVIIISRLIYALTTFVFNLKTKEKKE